MVDLANKTKFCSCDARFRKGRSTCKTCGGRIWKKKRRITFACALHVHYFCEDAGKTWTPGLCEDQCHNNGTHGLNPPALYKLAFFAFIIPLIGHLFDLGSTFIAYCNNPTLWANWEANTALVNLTASRIPYWTAAWKLDILPGGWLTIFLAISLLAVCTDLFLKHFDSEHYPREFLPRLIPYLVSLGLAWFGVYGGLSWATLLWFFHLG